MASPASRDWPRLTRPARCPPIAGGAAAGCNEGWIGVPWPAVRCINAFSADARNSDNCSLLAPLASACMTCPMKCSMALLSGWTISGGNEPAGAFSISGINFCDITPKWTMSLSRGDTGTSWPAMIDWSSIICWRVASIARDSTCSLGRITEFAMLSPSLRLQSSFRSSSWFTLGLPM